MHRKLAPALFLAGLGPLALAPPAAHGQTADQPSVQRQLEELRHLIEQQQKTIGELQSRVQALQGQETEMHQSVQQDSEARQKMAQLPLVTSTSRKLVVGLSGQVDRLLNLADDGKSTKAYFVDNNLSVSRLRFTASGQVTDEFNLGSNIELAVSPNNSNSVSQTGEEGQDTFNIRKAEAIFKDTRFGTVSFGKGDPATKDIARLDLSQTDVLAYAATGDVAGGLFFRTDGDGDDLTGVQISDVFTDFDSSRQGRIRYDTPAFHGAFASASYSANQRWGAALRWAGAGHGLQATAGFGIQDANTTVPTEPDANVNEVYAGSASVLHDATGLSLTYAGGLQDQDSGTGQLQYVKAGWQRKFFDWGSSAFSLDFGFNKDTPVDNDEGKTIGLVALQNLEGYGAQFFMGFRGYDLDQGNGPNTSTIYVGTFGTRIKF